MRFDRRAPAFLSGLAAFGDRQLWNPFYYQNGRLDEEIDTLYSEMARAMGQRSRLVAHLNLVRSYADLFSELDLPNLASEFLPLSNTAFLYMRWTHFSGNGNQVIAKLFFDILTGKESSKFSTFSIQPNPEHVEVSSLPALAENEISELFLAIDGQRFAQIVEGGSFARSVRGGNGSDASGEMSYLIVRERGGSFAESFIVDLPGRLSAESIV